MLTNFSFILNQTTCILINELALEKGLHQGWKQTSYLNLQSAISSTQRPKQGCFEQWCRQKTGKPPTLCFALIKTSNCRNIERSGRPVKDFSVPSYKPSISRQQYGRQSDQRATFADAGWHSPCVWREAQERVSMVVIQNKSVNQIQCSAQLARRRGAQSMLLCHKGALGHGCSKETSNSSKTKWK
eukprot:1148812-Pelagomonas_calceolata.AAC.14